MLKVMYPGDRNEDLENLIDNELSELGFQPRGQRLEYESEQDDPNAHEKGFIDSADQQAIQDIVGAAIAHLRVRAPRGIGPGTGTGSPFVGGFERQEDDVLRSLHQGEQRQDLGRRLHSVRVGDLLGSAHEEAPVQEGRRLRQRRDPPDPDSLEREKGLLRYHDGGYERTRSSVRRAVRGRPHSLPDGQQVPHRPGVCMSTQITTYVIFGIMFDYDEMPEDEHGDRSGGKAEAYLDSCYDKTMNPKGNVTLILDGMSGEYAVLGHVIAKSDEYGVLNVPVSIPIGDSEALRNDVLAAASDLGIKVDANPGWHVISHYR